MATGDSVAGSGPHPQESIKSFWGFGFCFGSKSAKAQHQRTGTREARAEPTNPVVFPFTTEVWSSPPPFLHVGPYFI